MSARRGVVVAVFVLLCGMAAGTVANAAENASPQPAAAGIRLNFRDAPLDAVLGYLSEVAGLSVVTDAPTEGRITLISKQPLSVSEAVAVLNSALKEKGYAALRVGKVLKIVALSDAKKASIPVRTGRNAAEITPSDQVITQVIPLRSVDAVKLKESLKALMPDYAELSADASSNSLVLTDTEANVRRIVEIVSALDATKQMVSDVKVFLLKYADAVSAAKLINDIFDAERSQGSQAGTSRALMRFRSMFRRGRTVGDRHQRPGPAPSDAARRLSGQAEPGGAVISHWETDHECRGCAARTRRASAEDGDGGPFSGGGWRDRHSRG